MRLSSAWMIAGVAGLCAVASAGPTTPTTAVFVTTATPTNPTSQQWDSAAWTAAAAVGSTTVQADWQILRNNPRNDELAVLSLSEDMGLRLRFWNTGGWGSTSTLTSSTGTIFRKVFDAAYEGVTGELMTVYRKGTSTSIYYRTFTSGSPSEQTYSPGLSGAPEEIQIVRRPGKDELVMIVASGANLYGAVWSGSSWGNFTTITSTLSTNGRPLAVGASVASGKAMVVWGNSGAHTPSYKTWDGTAWSATGTMASVGTGYPVAIQIAANPLSTSNELLVSIQDSAKLLSVCNWTGTAWGTMTTADSALANPYEGRSAVAYQKDGAKALLAYHTTGSYVIRYRTWNGTSWSAAQSGPDLSTDAQVIRLATGLYGSEIIGVAQRKALGTSLSDFLAYSQTGTVSVGTVEGLSGAAMPGISLPAAPTDIAGAVDKTYGNNTTAALAPGNYRDLNTGNSVTLNLSPGRYVFRQWTSNSLTSTFNCDTSTGDIDIVFTNGDVILSNNFTMNNTGPGRATIHVVNGNFDAKNNGGLIAASVVAYNGYIDFNMNTVIQGSLYASGDITISSGTIEGGSSPFNPTPSKLTAFRWDGSSFGPTTQLSTSVLGFTQRESFDVSRPPLGAPSLYISRWREIGPDE